MKRKNIDKVKLPRKLKKATKDLLSQETSVMIGALGTNVSELRFREGVRLKSHHRRLVAKFEGKLRTAFEAMSEAYEEEFAVVKSFLDNLPRNPGILYDEFESRYHF